MMADDFAQNGDFQALFVGRVIARLRSKRM
jgi:hypothetical protein